MRAPHVAGDVPASGGYLGAVPRAAKSGAAFVDFQNDVKDGDIETAVAEGFRSIEHVKRYTTTGMATDQGKTSNMNALAIAAKTLGRDIPQVGLTTFRMPYTPVTFGAIAGAARGDLFEPVRRTPIDAWAQDNGAVFEDVGAWKRAWYFRRDGEDKRAAVARECKTVREIAGLFDASTLGKIEIAGPDAAEFLDRIYATRVGDLAPGACRYALMLGEAGFVMDDGIVARLDENRFHATTTTGGAARVLAHMEDYLQTEWPDLQVWLTSTTEQWATIALQGPQARAILAPFAEGIDLSRGAFGHMRLREGRIAGVPARVFRVSFTGELGYEINVPASRGRAVWETLWDAAHAQGACAYGTEAMHVLRAEKGYIIVGQETDGTVTPGDLGMVWAVAKSKNDFVGKRSLARIDIVKPDRPQLVGLLTDDPEFVPDEGAQIVPRADPAPGSAALGHVTSAYASPVLGRSLALGLVAGGRKLLGSSVYVTTLQGTARATLVPPVFYDKDGVRLDG
jgi:sarcosine oxidase subunit alpha